jgi:hypothetical protein
MNVNARRPGALFIAVEAVPIRPLGYAGKRLPDLLIPVQTDSGPTPVTFRLQPFSVLFWVPKSVLNFQA